MQQQPSVENRTKNNHLATNITTMVRIRPLLHSEQEEREAIFAKDKKNIQIRMVGGRREESVENVFDTHCTQRKVFEQIRPFIQRSSQGFNVTIFTYGQTGSGKTYTMFGSDWNNIIKKHSVTSDSGAHNSPVQKKEKQLTFLRSLEQDENHAGLIPRTINMIFNQLITKRRKHIKVFCSFLQLYNENMMDLFEDDKEQMNKKMLIHENKNDGIYVQGLNEVQVLDLEHCLDLMQRGQRNRIVRQTHMNVKSSRSHTIFQLLIEEVFPSNKSYRRMKVNLCDLAGSEKINKSEKMQQEHFDQLKNINLSLTTLGKVICSLSEKTKSAPFRESKLTRLLQDSLGGNTYTAIVATITSKASCLQESFNTLKFLQRAKQIKTLVANKIFNENPEMRNLQKQIAYLKDVLKMKRTGVEIDLDVTEKMKKLQSQNQRLKEMVDRDLVQRLKKENMHLKQELVRKNNDNIFESEKMSTIDPTGNSEEVQSLADKMMEKNTIEKASSDAISSYSTNKLLGKDRKMLSTKTYTINNGDGRSTGKSESKLFPSIKSIGKKNSPASILERIHEIQRAKQANKIKLEQELSQIGSSQSFEKNSNFGRSSKYPTGNSRYNNSRYNNKY